MPVVVLALSSSLFLMAWPTSSAARGPTHARRRDDGGELRGLGSGAWSRGRVVVRMEVSTAAIGSGIAAGAFAVVGFLAFYGALVTGAMSILSPIVAATQAAVPVLADVVLLGTGPARSAGWVSPPYWAAVCSGPRPSAAPERCPSRRAFSPWGSVAGVTLGASTVCLDAAPAESGVLPVTFDVPHRPHGLGADRRAGAGCARRLVRRWAGALDVDARPRCRRRAGRARCERGEARRGSGGRRYLAGWAGLLLGVGNVFLMLGLHAGSLAVVAVLMGLYPLATVLLARVVLGERLARVQVVGVVAALAACVLLGLA
ncbi:MAG: EamA family transporter [Candidatus Nanopelagicales bacterium]